MFRERSALRWGDQRSYVREVRAQKMTGENLARQ